jgi:23S rRNA pseudouridine1911/1915/1917 synthase
MAEKLTVGQESSLLDFLFASLDGWSKKTIKQRLQNKHIYVNQENITKHNFLLKQGDIVEIGKGKKIQEKDTQSLEILYQDKDLIAIYKPAGLLSVSNSTENKNHALSLLRSQLSKGKFKAKLWPVHRLDRDTSGVLLFATSKEMREAVMANWDKAQKTYLAIVKGKPKQPKATINQPLRQDEKIYRMLVGKHPQAKEAITHYELKESKEKTSLLEVRIDTGRQHQIRVHLSWLGHSIVGDERYGKKGERMGLHAKSLQITHPKSKKILHFEKDAPREFYALLN